MYRQMLKSLIDIADCHLEPEVIITDFEDAFIKAVEEVFPDSHLHGCNFHFAQCILRQVNNMNLKSRYNRDDEFALHIKMMIALAFIPPAFVIKAFELVISVEFFLKNEELGPLVEYFRETWIGIERRNGQTSARFSIASWNCYYEVVNDEPRTNNCMEGWHNSFHQRVGRCNEQLGKFINVLKVEQASSEAIWEQHNCGRVVASRKRRKYVDYDARLYAVVSSWCEDADILEYLRGIAHNVCS